jgi:general secretion pathway protein B
MSVILDALKKLDREKLSRRGGMANIAVEILRPDPHHLVKRNSLYFAIISLTAIATVAITYMAMVKFDFVPKSSSPPPGHPPKLSERVASAPVEFGSLSTSSSPAPVSPPASSQQIPPAPFFAETVREARDEISRIPLKTQRPDENENPAISAEDKKANPSVISEKVDVTPGNTRKAIGTPNESATTPPLLKLSAIVWYEQPSERFAVINGIKANEGSVIEGVKVVEIHPTSVRFLYNGQHFEISMSR